MFFKVIVIIFKLVPLSFTNAITLFRSPNGPNKSFICLAIIVPTVLSIIVTWHGCHNAFMKEITKAKVSLMPHDIHKSKVVMQVMQSANIEFTKFSMVLVTKVGNTSLANRCLDGKTTFPHCRNTNRFNHASSIVERQWWFEECLLKRVILIVGLG